jgi:hypothetical protein
LDTKKARLILIMGRGEKEQVDIAGPSSRSMVAYDELISQIDSLKRQLEVQKLSTNLTMQTYDGLKNQINSLKIELKSLRQQLETQERRQRRSEEIVGWVINDADLNYLTYCIFCKVGMKYHERYQLSLSLPQYRPDQFSCEKCVRRMHDIRVWRDLL